MKKVIAVALAIIMALSLGASAFAAAYQVTDVDNSADNPNYQTPIESNMVYIKPYDARVSASNSYKIPIVMRSKDVDLQGVESGTLYMAFGIALGTQYKIDETGKALVDDSGNPQISTDEVFNMTFPEEDTVVEDLMSCDCFEYSEEVKALADFVPEDMYSMGDSLLICFSTTDLSILQAPEFVLGYVTVDCLDAYAGGVALPILTDAGDIAAESIVVPGLADLDGIDQVSTNIVVVADDGSYVEVPTAALAGQLADHFQWDPAAEPSWQDKLLNWLKNLGLSIIGFFITILELLEGLLASV
ncbi:MAG: hypothetical protein PUB20_08980 [Clostridia bacterium]|nr:hypothetical protein [Clostridia bacterium]